MLTSLKKLFGSGLKAPAAPPSRNDVCWCGSGEKYKRCHMDKDLERQRLKAAACRKYS